MKLVPIQGLSIVKAAACRHSKRDAGQLGSCSQTRVARNSGSGKPLRGRAGGRECEATQRAGGGEDGAGYRKKKRRRTLRRSRYEVRVDKDNTTRRSWLLSEAKCQALDVSRSCYYDSLQVKSLTRKQEDVRLKVDSPHDTAWRSNLPVCNNGGEFTGLLPDLWPATTRRISTSAALTLHRQQLHRDL